MGSVEAVFCSGIANGFLVASVVDGHLHEPSWFPPFQHLCMAWLWYFHGGEVVILVVGRPGSLTLVGNVCFSWVFF